jgi:NAD(P)-dependent dehydrogenase (short-subunit alcohol dehydrogenase family)
MTTLSGRTILITGASSGIGAALALAAAKAGAKVAAAGGDLGDQGLQLVRPARGG